MLSAWIYAGLRAAGQAILPSLATALAFLPAEQRTALVLLLATLAASAVMGLVVAGIRWLETRTGDSWQARAARFLARIVMLGLSKWQPVYAQASSTTTPQAVALQRADNVPVSIRGVPTVAQVLPER